MNKDTEISDISENTAAKNMSEVKRLLLDKSVLAHIIQYIVPEYRNTPIEEISAQIVNVKDIKNAWYDLTFEFTLKGKKAGGILFIEGSQIKEGPDIDNFGEEGFPFQDDTDPDYSIPKIIYMIRLCSSAKNTEVGHDAFYTLFEEIPQKSSRPILRQSAENFVLNFTELRFNRTAKTNGIHRLLQIIFLGAANTNALLRNEFGIEPK